MPPCMSNNKYCKGLTTFLDRVESCTRLCLEAGFMRAGEEHATPSHSSAAMQDHRASSRRQERRSPKRVRRLALPRDMTQFHCGP